ncbi:MAG: choice-of-anchor L domain-containing protein, partial [Fimbriimonadaceae bacterium]|nr:choice-of-anchor L domain-containing protein [Chitinophagales bacterium]
MNLYISIKCFVFLITICLLNSSVFSQLIVTEVDIGDIDEFAEILSGPGIEITDVSVTCAYGAFGTFNCFDCNLGIEEGILLTTGTIYSAVGPNDEVSSGILNFDPGDDDLDEIGYVNDILSPDDYTKDACTLEFDVTSVIETVSLNFVFGSEEYPTNDGCFDSDTTGYVGTDIFAFFISGENIAYLPDGITLISIPNINECENIDYYNYNGDGYEEPYLSDPYYIQYNGFTDKINIYK